MYSKWILISAIAVSSVFCQFQLVASASKANLTTLRVAQVIFRHGARNIDEPYPMDPYRNESYWAPGYSQLNNIGKLQGFKLGVYLRERYDGFVKDTYDHKDIYVQSSDLLRTMQTAYSAMAGFYLPNDISDVNITDERIMKSKVEIPLPWKPVPVHTIPVTSDNIIRQQASVCPRYAQMLDELKSQDITPPTEEEKQTFAYVSEHMGVNITNVIDFGLRMDTIYIERYYNFTLPNWTEPILNISVRSAYFSSLTKTFEMKRLRVGPLLERLLANMLVNETALLNNELQRSRNGQKKIYIFSGHDETITGVLNTLGMFDSKRPAFTSALLLELHQDTSTQELCVEFYYRNETDRDPYKLEIPNCDQPCLLSDFQKLVEPYIPLAWGEECQALGESGYISGTWIALIIIAVWVAMFIVLQCWIRTGRKRRSRGDPQRDSYTHLK